MGASKSTKDAPLLSEAHCATGRNPKLVAWQTRYEEFEGSLDQDNVCTWALKYVAVPFPFLFGVVTLCEVAGGVSPTRLRKLYFATKHGFKGAPLLDIRHGARGMAARLESFLR